MGWGKWAKDSSGGQVKTKTVTHTGGSTDTHILRTRDNTRSGSKENHSHVMVRENQSGSKSAHGFHGIKKP